MSMLERAVDIISNSILEDIKRYEERWNCRGEITNMQEYLDNVAGLSSREFKNDMMWLINNYNNENYSKGIKDRINMWDDGTIEEKDGTTYSYRTIMSLVRKKVFKDTEEPED